jgi:hypothetical protein
VLPISIKLKQKSQSNMAMSMAVENGRLDAEYHWRRRRRWFAENFNFRDEVMCVCVLVGD